MYLRHQLFKLTHFTPLRGSLRSCYATQNIQRASSTVNPVHPSLRRMVGPKLFEIQRATEADCHELAIVEGRAFQDDVSAQVTFDWSEDLCDWRAEVFRRSLSDPRQQIYKAVTPEGKIGGLAKWHFVPDPEQEAAELAQKEAEKEKKKGTPEEEPEYPPGVNKEAWDAIFVNLIYRQRKMVIGEKRAVLELLVVDPAYWGRGYGKALLAHGCEIAKNMDLNFVWLEATPAGRPLYKKVGFVEVDHGEVDLSKWGKNEKAQSTGMKYFISKGGQQN